jgi:hypothetical protein
MKQTFFSIILSVLCLFAGNKVSAQATIGSLDDPQPFSILELVGGGTLGFRLPQLNTFQRDAMVATPEFQAEKSGKARGLQIFNTISKCVETWNGSKWIEACPPEGPTPTPVPPSPTSASCGITPNSGNDTEYTAKDDPNAEYYEFFLDDKSQGIQSSNQITFDQAQAASNVKVKYYYSPEFLKPEMIEVEGGSFTLGGAVQNSSGGSSGTTTDSISVTVQSFKMSKTEITQAQFEFVMGDISTNRPYFSCNGSGSSDVTNRPTSALPVEYQNWYHAITY